MRTIPRRSGSAATETALIFALLACGILIAYANLGGQAQRVFGRLSFDRLAASESPTASQLAANSRPGNAPIPQQFPGSNRPIVAVYLALLAAVSCLGVAAFATFRKPAPAPSDDEILEETSQKTDELPRTLFAKRQDLLHVLQKSLADYSPSELPVRLAMTARPVCAAPNTPVDELRRLMQEQRRRHLLIVDQTGNLLGVVSDRDLLSKTGKTAGQIMTRAPISVSPETPLTAAVTIFINRRFSSLPVVDQDKLVGILTTTDILLALQATVLLWQLPKSS